MKLKVIKRYNKDEYTFKKLKGYEIKAIRVPRGITESLREKLK